VPPEGLTEFPEGVAQRLPAGARLRIVVSYQKGGEDPGVPHTLALYFSGKPSQQLHHLRVPCDTSRIRDDIQALAVSPQLGSFGSSVELLARRVDGSAEPLAWIRNFQRQYQATYWFRRPVDLPRGTTLDVRSSEL